MYAKKNSGMKVAATLLAIVLLISCVVGGTIAWLMDSTKEVTNTFTVGDINIDLTETVSGDSKSAKDSKVENNTFKIVPGKTEAKDPTITVEAGSEACYVFVKITDNTTIDSVKYVEWTIADGWTKLEDGVFYRTYTVAANESYAVLKDNKVTYPSELTKVNLEAINTENAEKPSLSFAAYAVQMVKDNGTNFTAEEAWGIAQNNGQIPSVTP